MIIIISLSTFDRNLSTVELRSDFSASFSAGAAAHQIGGTKLDHRLELQQLPIECSTDSYPVKINTLQIITLKKSLNNINITLIFNKMLLKKY